MTTPAEKDAMALAGLAHVAENMVPLATKKDVQVRLERAERFASNIRTHSDHLAARVAELEAERDEANERAARTAAQYQHEFEAHGQTIERADRAEAELAAMREDAALLSWLADEWDKNGVISATRYATGTAGCGLFTISSQHVRGYGLRAAIDAARGAG